MHRRPYIHIVMFPSHLICTLFWNGTQVVWICCLDRPVSILAYDGLDSIAPTDDWLGKFSTKPPIKNGKLWLSQHLDSIGLRDNDKIDLASAIANAKANQHSKPAQF